jgi:hypothetical protein
MNTKTLFIISTILIQVTSARSQGTLTWQFDSTNFVVQPTDNILITGTVINSSDTPYVIPNGTAAFWTGDLYAHYNFSWLINDIVGETVPAQGTLQFDFGTLAPIGDYVQPGVYQPGGVYYPGGADQPSPGAIDLGAGLQYSDNAFVVTVVPEPSTMALLAAGGGMAGLLLRRRSLIRRCCLTNREAV